MLLITRGTRTEIKCNTGKASNLSNLERGIDETRLRVFPQNQPGMVVSNRGREAYSTITETLPSLKKELPSASKLMLKDM
jgi:hypothetical protein